MGADTAVGADGGAFSTAEATGVLVDPPPAEVVPAGAVAC